MLLWTRRCGATEGEWVVARDPALEDIVASGRARTGPEQDHTLVVDVDGLAAATTFWYRFAADGAQSPVGRTRRLPEAPTGHLAWAWCAAPTPTATAGGDPRRLSRPPGADA